MSTERDTTIEERMKWGECPVCKAKHGEFCLPVGLVMGVKANGSPLGQGDGVHVQRISKAPMRVKLVPA